MTKAYLFGVLHDATERKTTFRIATNNYLYCQFLKKEIEKLGSKAWIYKEGKNRNLWIVEFSKSFLKNTKIESKMDKIDYIRGYFDSEGGIPKSSRVRFYLYFAQKDRKDLSQVKKYIEELNISCGIIHNPSKRVDPKYWRFYISSKSYKKFINIIGSYHPEKAKVMRMKI